MNTQYLTVSDGKIAYDDVGQGPLVICVPGMGDLRQNYRFLTPQLVSAGYRVTTMDVRGHGETSVNWKDVSVAGIGSDILALSRHLNAGPAIVIGNSMAAGAAVWVAVEAPDQVGALVLISPFVRGDSSWQFNMLYNILFTRPWGPSAWMMYYKTLYPTRKPVDWVEYTQMLKQNMDQPDRIESLHRMMSASKAASASRLTRLIIPSLVIMGSKDPDFKDPSAEAESIAGQIKGKTQMVPGAGHYPQAESPEITGPIILDFLKTLQLEVNYAAI